MLAQLLYVSERSEHCTDKEVDSILDASIRNNDPEKITGVLLYNEDRFVQYVEGEHRDLIVLFDKIREDNRHRNIVLITLSRIDKRNFPNWHMGSRDVGVGGIDYKTKLAPVEIAVFNNLLEGDDLAANDGVGLLKKLFELDAAA